VRGGQEKAVRAEKVATLQETIKSTDKRVGKVKTWQTPGINGGRIVLTSFSPKDNIAEFDHRAGKATQKTKVDVNSRKT